MLIDTNEDHCLYFQLTELHLINIAKHLTNGIIVKELATHLGLQKHEAEAAVYDGKSITEAGLKVLEIFRGRLKSAEEACGLLGEALIKCELGHVAEEVLGFPCGLEQEPQ